MKTKLTAILIILFSSIALAIPGVPHQFYGSVAVNGAPAADGTVVSARINGIEVSSTTTSGGKYGYSPIFYIDDPANTRAGKTIEFFVSGVNTGITAVFVNGASTKLDLSATVETATTTTQPSGGGGGGGGGATTTTTIVTTTTLAGPTTTAGCQEQWKCSDWSACNADGLQTRLCYDENHCGTENDKPFESQPCTTVETGSESNEITGMLIATLTNPVVAIIIIIIIAVIAYLIFKSRKKKQ